MKILNIGSLNIDKTYSVEQFVRPKETIRALSYEEFCGGKGLNQSVALSRAGAETYHAGAVGQDGEMLLSILREAGVHTEYVKKTEGVSGHAVIQLDQTRQNNIIITGGANDAVDQAYVKEILEKFEAGDLVLLQNEIPSTDYAIRKAHERGLLIAFNPSPMNETVQRCDLNLVDYLIVNEVEGRLLAETDSEEPKAILDALRETYPQCGIVLTLGEGGVYFSRPGKLIYQPSYSVDVVDTTGAGDTFCGYFLAGIARGLPDERSLREASAAAAIAVSRKGAAPGIPEREEMEAFVIEAKTGKTIRA